MRNYLSQISIIEKNNSEGHSEQNLCKQDDDVWEKVTRTKRFIIIHSGTHKYDFRIFIFIRLFFFF